MIYTRKLLTFTLSIAIVVMLTVGCMPSRILNKSVFNFGNQADPAGSCADTCSDSIGVTCNTTDVYAQQATAIEYPAVSEATLEATGSSAYSDKPRTLTDLNEVAYRNLRLEEVIQLGLQHATVLRDLGGTVINSPKGQPPTTMHLYGKPILRLASMLP